MPPVVLDDSEVADVMTFVRNSWGNTDDVPLTADEVRRVRARTQIPTYAKLLEAGTYQPLRRRRRAARCVKWSA
jgi:hypothetical protein